MKSIVAMLCVSLVACAGALAVVPTVKSVYDIATDACVKYYSDHPDQASSAAGIVCADDAKLQPFIDLLLTLIPDAGAKSASTGTSSAASHAKPANEPNPYTAKP
jgi:hypothetical protein